MFAHVFKYRFKCLLRDRWSVFWTLVFPLLLATFFYMAFSNIDKSEIFEPINIAVVDDEQYRNDQAFREALSQASAGDDRLFDLTVASEAEADRLLDENLIDGYILVRSPMKLVVRNSGLKQSIIKSFIDNYVQTVSAVKAILKEDPAAQEGLIRDLANRVKYVREVSATSAEPDNILLYFYSLIAMSCLYGSLMGSREVTDIQADISPVASRVNAAPVHKLKLFICNISAAFVIHFSEMLVLLAYLMFVLRIDFGPRTGFVVLTTFLGSAAGLSFGAFVSALGKKSEGIKIAVIIGVTMLCSFLSGMMYQDMKYIIAQKVPVLSFLNPVNLLTDAFYSLYYYDSLSRYAFNAAALLALTLIFCSSVYLIIRRREYASL